MELSTNDWFRKIETLLLSKKSVFNLNELSEYSGFSKSHLYKLTSSGKIPHYKPNGKYIFFDRKEIEKWLLRNRVKTVDEIEAEASTFVTLNTKQGKQWKKKNKARIL